MFKRPPGDGNKTPSKLFLDRVCIVVSNTGGMGLVVSLQGMLSGKILAKCYLIKSTLERRNAVHQLDKAFLGVKRG